MQIPALLNRNFRARFHAWWEGYDFAPPDAVVEGADGEHAAEKPAAKSLSKEPWPRERIEAAQLLWGREFVSPLDAAALADLALTLALEPDMGVLHLGCGLGGGMRALVHEYRVKASGLEITATLAKAGMELSTAAKLRSEAPIGPVDLAKVEMKPGAFERALIEYVLHTVGDKEGALKRVLHALKPGAKVLILDFVVQGRAPGGAVAGWAALDPMPVKPWNLDAARKALAKLNIDVGDVTDETGRLCADAMRDLDRFLKDGENQSLTPPVTAALKREVDLWLARKAALDAGEIKALAIHGVKAR